MCFNSRYLRATWRVAGSLSFLLVFWGTATAETVTFPIAVNPFTPNGYEVAAYIHALLGKCDLVYTDGYYKVYAVPKSF